MTIGMNDPVDQVWDLMAEQRMWLLPVLDRRRLVGVIHYSTARANERGRAGSRSAPHARPTSMQGSLPAPPDRVRYGGQPGNFLDHRPEPDTGHRQSGGHRRNETR
jgi:hypothetical protein